MVNRKYTHSWCRKTTSFLPWVRGGGSADKNQKTKHQTVKPSLSHKKLKPLAILPITKEPFWVCEWNEFDEKAPGRLLVKILHFLWWQITKKVCWMHTWWMHRHQQPKCKACAIYVFPESIPTLRQRHFLKLLMRQLPETKSILEGKNTFQLVDFMRIIQSRVFAPLFVYLTRQESWQNLKKRKKWLKRIDVLCYLPKHTCWSKVLSIYYFYFYCFCFIFFFVFFLLFSVLPWRSQAHTQARSVAKLFALPPQPP